MPVGKLERKSLRIIYLLVEAVEVDIIVAAALHFGKLKLLLFRSHIVYINDLGIMLGKFTSYR